MILYTPDPAFTAGRRSGQHYDVKGHRAVQGPQLSRDWLVGDQGGGATATGDYIRLKRAGHLLHTSDNYGDNDLLRNHIDVNVWCLSRPRPMFFLLTV